MASERVTELPVSPRCVRLIVVAVVWLEASGRITNKGPKPLRSCWIAVLSMLCKIVGHLERQEKGVVDL